jgi:heterodisulfide reductase subunit A
MRLEPKHLIHAFDKGVIGVFLGDGTANALNGAVKANVAKRVGELKRYAGEAGIEPERIYYYEAYLPHFRGLAAKLETFALHLESMKDPVPCIPQPEARLDAIQ